MLVIPLLIFLLLVGFLSLSWNEPVVNYTSPMAPEYTGSYAVESPAFDGTIKVVSYNISFADNVDLAVQELSRFDDLQDSDIILLQEMDETGTQTIAQALSFNYVYYPASIHSRHHRNFGNAILSRWPIVEPERIVLPYVNPKDGQERVATRAIVKIGQIEILTYSVHTETFWMGPRKRDAQVEYLIENIADFQPYVIVGGDFNTLTPASVSSLESRFVEAGMLRMSQASESTLAPPALGLIVDHIYARGLAVSQSGVVEDARASDHLPVWVQLTLPTGFRYPASRFDSWMSTLGAMGL
jgi:endonuclease/exonuclease/phosphatase family metal-dependent hydrolase